MKRLHRRDLYGWSTFNERLNLDFHSVLWVRPAGNIVIDPLPLSAHDANHLRELGGVKMIVITNSDHLRDSAALASVYAAEVCGPRGEASTFPLRCSRWLGDGDEVVPGLSVLELAGSKTPGELALLLEGSTLITGDVVRAHAAGRLCLLPDAKLKDKAAVVESLRRLTELRDVDAVLVGDGWPVFRHGKEALAELLAAL